MFACWFRYCLLLALLLAGCGEARHNALPPGATVLVLGDSISYGTGAAPGEDYPALLAARSGWRVVNAGVPGDTTAGALQRLPGLLDAHAPQLLLVELGGNDFLQRLPRSETRANLEAILETARARGITAVLVAMPSFNPLGAAVGGLSDHPLYEQLAEESGAPLVRDAVAEVLAQEELRADPIHPNAAGYRQLEQQLSRSLAEYGLLY